MRSVLRLVLCSAAVTLSLGLAACGAADEAALDGLPLADEIQDTMGEKADGAVSYLWARPNPGVIRCLRAPCESHLNRAVNGAQGRPVYLYDLRSLRVSAARRAEVSARLGELLVRGRYNTITVSGEQVAVFQVTRAMEPVSERSSDSPTDDRYYVLSTPSGTCGKGCTLAARPINVGSGGTSQAWSAVDLGQLGLPAATEAALRAELPTGAVNLAVRNVTSGAAKASQAFRLITAAPLP